MSTTTPESPSTTSHSTRSLLLDYRSSGGRSASAGPGLAGPASAASCRGRDWNVPRLAFSEPLPDRVSYACSVACASFASYGPDVRSPISESAAPPPTLTPAEVAAQLDVTPTTVRRWLADGRLDGERVGGRLRVDSESLGNVRQTIRRTAE